MDNRRSSGACARNREPIANVLDAVLPSEGLVLEVGCGSGEHALFFSQRYPGLRWQPADFDPVARASAAAWKAHEGGDNMLEPLEIDASSEVWPVERADAVFSANVIHISPWEVGLGLLSGAARILPTGGVLVIYGPFMVGGQHTAPSNVQFDGWLKSQDVRWGVRELETVQAEAASRGLVLEHVVDMPANNKTLVFRKGG